MAFAWASFAFNSNGISFAAQLHDDTSIELRHQTLDLTRDDIQLNVQTTTVSLWNEVLSVILP